MAGSWGVKPMFTYLNLNAWAFWIVLFVMIVTIFAFMRILYLICLRKLKRHSISVIDLNERNNRNSTQDIYTSVIAPNYFYNNDQISESVNALNANKNIKYFEKFMKREDTFEGVDCVSESCDTKTTAIRPLTPAYKPHEVVTKEDPLGFLLVPPGYVTTLNNNNVYRFERMTHSA